MTTPQIDMLKKLVEFRKSSPSRVESRDEISLLSEDRLRGDFELALNKPKFWRKSEPIMIKTERDRDFHDMTRAVAEARQLDYTRIDFHLSNSMSCLDGVLLPSTTLESVLEKIQKEAQEKGTSVMLAISGLANADYHIGKLKEIVDTGAYPEIQMVIQHPEKLSSSNLGKTMMIEMLRERCLFLDQEKIKQDILTTPAQKSTLG